eukprot:1030350-Amphidinium_carterae.1
MLEGVDRTWGEAENKVLVKRFADKYNITEVLRWSCDPSVQTRLLPPRLRSSTEVAWEFMPIELPSPCLRCRLLFWQFPLFRAWGPPAGQLESTKTHRPTTTSRTRIKHVENQW